MMRFLLFLGAVLFLFNASSFPSPFCKVLCHLNRVGLETLKASLVAKSPYFSQKARIRHLSFACSVIIYRKRIILSQPEINLQSNQVHKVRYILHSLVDKKSEDI